MEGNADMTAYQEHYGLPSDHSIRLLKIFHAEVPEDGTEPSVLYVIQPFELDRCPEFVALSYTWSDPMRNDVNSTEESSSSVDNQTIAAVSSVIRRLVNTGPAEEDEEEEEQISRSETRTTQATENLRAALIQLYLSGLGDTWIWADAVCIDQENNVEKAKQVSMMDEIYSRAQVVIVWLGADTTDVEEFAWLHGEFMDSLNLYLLQDGRSIDTLRRHGPLDPGFISQLGITPPGGSWIDCWRKLFNFYRRRRWFSRAWVVQEVTLARLIVVQSGSVSLKWDEMVLLGRMLQVLGWQVGLSPDVNTGFGRALGDEIIRLSVIRDTLGIPGANLQFGRSSFTATSTRTDNQGSDPGPGPISSREKRLGWMRYMQDLLCNTRVYTSADPRDKIYSILGIAKRALPDGMVLPIIPDYSPECTPCSLFTSIASMFLGEIPFLENLSLVQDRASTKIQGMPSWVADYTVQLTGTPFIYLRNYSCAFNCGSSPTSPTDPACEVLGDRLLVRGAELDTIVATCTPMWDIVRTQVIQECLELCEHVSPEYFGTHSGPGEVLWRTICADSFMSEPAPPSMAESFKCWVAVRLARAVVPSIMDIIQNEDMRLGGFDVGSYAESLDILNRLRLLEVSPGGSGIPSIHEVQQKCRLMFLYELQRLTTRNGIEHPGGRLFPTPEEHMTQIEGEAASFQTAISPAIPFRRLYRTENGYLGLGPASAEVGDKVWMLQSARVPFVLRQRDGEFFSLIGETYLHGFMGGAARQRVGAGVQDIQLQ